MINAHPFQNVYFNKLAGTDWKRNFEVDYWGLAGREALSHILQRDKRRVIRVWSASFMPLSTSAALLPLDQRQRLVYVDNVDKADYIITNYRWNLTDYGAPPFELHLVREIKVENEIITSIYRGTAQPIDWDNRAIDEAQAVSIDLQVGAVQAYGERLQFEVTVINASDKSLDSLPDGISQLKLSWRIAPVDVIGAESLIPGWDSRKNLEGSIPAGGTQLHTVEVSLPTKPGRYRLEVSVVQEGVVWLHDIGMPIASTIFDVPLER